MSTINAIMAELQAGEVAKARVPELEAMIRSNQLEIERLQKHNQALELKGRDRDDTIEQQIKAISKLREERDDASFRELEAQDRFTTLLDSVRPIWSSLGHALNRADPPKAERVVEPVKVEEVKAEAKPDPTQAGSPISSPVIPTVEGQSEPRQPSAGTVEAAGGPVSAIEPAVALAAQPWTPSVEMPKVWEEQAPKDEVPEWLQVKPAAKTIEPTF